LEKFIFNIEVAVLPFKRTFFMSTQPLYLLNCSSSYLSASINDQSSFPITLKPNTNANRSIPWSDKALWGGQNPTSGVLAEQSNILVLRFGKSASDPSPADKVYMQLALPGYQNASGPKPNPGSLCIWIYQNFLLFSQIGKAHLQGYGTLPPAPGWRVTPM
jgi:hypothetical protein